MEEAISHMNRALDLDPLSAIVNCDFGATYTYAGRFDDALRQYRATLDARAP
jgi:Flp pilus assembly protein TadD